MYNYILDPIQNKKINIHNNLGKNIIKQYLMFITGGGQTFDKLNDNNIHEAVKMYCGGDEKKKKNNKKARRNRKVGCFTCDKYERTI